MKNDYCFHTHTYRCGHAIGEDIDYVNSAINNRITTLGFSDHIMLPDINTPSTRGSFSMMPGYLDSIKSLKEQFKNKVDIYLGFESEYCEKYNNLYKELFIEKGIDYLILGQHFDFNEENPKYVATYKDDHNYSKKYAKQVCDAIRTGMFLYVAHPDLYVIAYTEWDDVLESIAHEICKCAEEYHIPLEINAHARSCWKRTSLVYPYDKFWEVASKYNIEVVLGYDAHNPNEFNEDISFFFEIVKKHNLKIGDIQKYLKVYKKNLKTIFKD